MLWNKNNIYGLLNADFEWRGSNKRNSRNNC